MKVGLEVKAHASKDPINLSQAWIDAQSQSQRLKRVGKGLQIAHHPSPPITGLSACALSVHMPSE